LDDLWVMGRASPSASLLLCVSALSRSCRWGQQVRVQLFTLYPRLRVPLPPLRVLRGEPLCALAPWRRCVQAFYGPVLWLVAHADRLAQEAHQGVAGAEVLHDAGEQRGSGKWGQACAIALSPLYAPRSPNNAIAQA